MNAFLIDSPPRTGVWMGRGRVAMLMFLFMGVLPACPAKTGPSPQNAGALSAGGDRPPSGLASAPTPGPGVLQRDIVDFDSCRNRDVPATSGETEELDSIRCPLPSGLVAEETGSACVTVNRLLDSQGNRLFESAIDTPNGLVLVVDRNFEVYRCGELPYAVLQSGQLFQEGSSVDSPCHAANPVRRSFAVQDLMTNKRHEDLTQERATALIHQISQSTPCGAPRPQGTRRGEAPQYVVRAALRSADHGPALGVPH